MTILGVWNGGGEEDWCNDVGARIFADVVGEQCMESIGEGLRRNILECVGGTSIVALRKIVPANGARRGYGGDGDVRYGDEVFEEFSAR
jgi:hypothetical protein